MRPVGRGGAVSLTLDGREEVGGVDVLSAAIIIFDKRYASADTSRRAAENLLPASERSKLVREAATSYLLP